MSHVQPDPGHLPLSTLEAMTRAYYDAVPHRDPRDLVRKLLQAALDEGGVVTKDQLLYAARQETK